MKKIKVKTRKGVSRRFHVTGAGKIMRRIQNRRHLRNNKSKKAIRNYRIPVEVTGKFAVKIRKMLGLA
ncbi:MAG: 50S ribosomal protein L35 [Candidatus Pacebacteria bacterium GW2011_GWF2_38_9]|jgi:ribosomal protein L35|nr:MAG: 50S ribosomal protein L35P, large subunit ribosomal protein L35 [candidate division TM6 bacterium GW2011_GWF2_28_16]KKQ10099.1 MAG: 50S ribosomal protein L35 [Candidatus Pacebacteria bacterium GW2011_GWF1_36_5]KKQ89055.1 MAG: 50S ribosomal protein L35 [Candidatus Pacebacteria bacterium GW2011_GWF2_38_9]MBU1034004.1 50S ribosomal protein L35 [Patescibacteria group bacterium]HAZ73557.1 50S ribosomal protein L35 [Candidatus Paceibacterota bacterium]